ncbi:MAG: DUF4446 family protein [bacterium]
MFYLSADILSIGLIALSVVVLILLIMVIGIQMRLKNLLKSGAKSIEESITSMIKHIDDLEVFKKESQEYLTLVEKRLRNGIQGVDTLRFNPFKGTGSGGNQSFSTAFINEQGDGVVFSSLYSSDRMSVFAKPIEKFKSTFELTEEEAKSIAMAHDRLVSPKV